MFRTLKMNHVKFSDWVILYTKFLYFLKKTNSFSRHIYLFGFPETLLNFYPFCATYYSLWKKIFGFLASFLVSDVILRIHAVSFWSDQSENTDLAPFIYFRWTAANFGKGISSEKKGLLSKHRYFLRNYISDTLLETKLKLITCKIRAQ